MLIPERDPDTGRVVQVYPSISKEKLELFPEVKAADQELRAAELRDGLSVLYVALTRAKYALHLILPAEGGTKKHGAGLIREALALEDEKASDAGVLLERGDPRWFDQLEGKAEPMDEKRPPKETDPSAPLLRPSATGPGRNLARRSPSSLEGGNRVDLSFALRLDAAPALQRGEVVHAWCGEIEWSEDWTGDNDVLRAIARERAPGIPDDQIASLIAEFRDWMEAEPIRRAMSRDSFPSAPDTIVNVENELPFVRRVGDEIQEGFIDRLVLIQRDGRVVRAEILDFKTDTIESGDDDTLAARTEHYRPQIVAYCDVVQERYGLAKGDVAAKLVFLGVGVVRAVV